MGEEFGALSGNLKLRIRRPRLHRGWHDGRSRRSSNRMSIPRGSTPCPTGRPGGSRRSRPGRCSRCPFGRPPPPTGTARPTGFLRPSAAADGPLRTLPAQPDPRGLVGWRVSPRWFLSVLAWSSASTTLGPKNALLLVAATLFSNTTSWTTVPEGHSYSSAGAVAPAKFAPRSSTPPTVGENLRSRSTQAHPHSR